MRKQFVVSLWMGQSPLGTTLWVLVAIYVRARVNVIIENLHFDLTVCRQIKICIILFEIPQNKLSKEYTCSKYTLMDAKGYKTPGNLNQTFVFVCFYIAMLEF